MSTRALANIAQTPTKIGSTRVARAPTSPTTRCHGLVATATATSLPRAPRSWRRMTSEVTERSAVRASVTQASRPSTPSMGAAAVTAASTASSASRVPERLGRPMRGSPHGPWPSRAASQSDSESGTGAPGWRRAAPGAGGAG